MTRGLVVVVVSAESRCDAVVAGRESVRDEVVRVEGTVGDGLVPSCVNDEVGFYYARATTNVMDGVVDEFGDTCFVEVEDKGRMREWVVYCLDSDDERDLFRDEFECSGNVYVYDGRGEGVEWVTDSEVFEEMLDECDADEYAVLMSTKF